MVSLISSSFNALRQTIRPPKARLPPTLFRIERQQTPSIVVVGNSASSSSTSPASSVASGNDYIDDPNNIPFSIPLYACNISTHVPSIRIGSVEEGELLQVLPHHIRIADEELLEENLEKYCSGLAKLNCILVEKELWRKWGPPLHRDGKRIHSVSSSEADESVSSSHRTIVNSTNLPPWIPVRIAPKEMKVEAVAMPGQATPKLEYTDCLMESKYLSAQFLKPTRFQMGDQVTTRFSSPPSHLFITLFDKLEKKFPNIFQESIEWRWEKHRKSAFKEDKDGTINIQEGWKDKDAYLDWYDRELPSAIIGSSSTDSQVVSSSTTTPTVSNSNPVLSRLQSRIDTMRYLYETLRKLPGEVRKGELPAPLSLALLYPTGTYAWRDFRLWWDSRLSEYYIGSIAGPAYHGRYMLQRPPGAAPERLESPPWVFISKEDRYQRHKNFGRLAMAFTLCWSSIEFFLNNRKSRYVQKSVENSYSNEKATMASNDAHFGGTHSGMNNGQKDPEDKEIQVINDDGSISVTTAVSQSALRDNIVFRKCEAYRTEGRSYNWRLASIPFVGFHIFNFLLVYPFAVRGTYFFVQHAYSSFFVTATLSWIFWHDLFMV